MIEGLRAGIEQQLRANKWVHMVGCCDRLMELQHELIQDRNDLFDLHAQVLGGVLHEGVTTQAVPPA